jgi:hypothetical protein
MIETVVFSNFWIYGILVGKIQICYQCEHLTVFCLHTQFLDGHRITDIGFLDGFEFHAS